MKIDSLSTNKLRNDEHFQFCTEVKTLVNEHEASILKIEELFNAYLLKYEAEDAALKKISKSPFTQLIHEKDKARDNAWTGLSETCSAALRRADPVAKEGARKCRIVVDGYGDVPRKSLNEETSAIHNALQDLTGRYHADAVAAGLAPWLAELQAANDAVAALIRERYDETAAKRDVVMRAARIETDEAYAAMAESINARITLGDTEYAQFVQTLNTIIARYALYIKMHAGHGKRAEAPAKQGAQGEEEKKNT